MTAPGLTADCTGARPTVSVVVAALSSERWDWLCAAVASVAPPTSPALEAIVVIDHKPDLLARARRELAGGEPGLRQPGGFGRGGWRDRCGVCLPVAG